MVERLNEEFKEKSLLFCLRTQGNGMIRKDLLHKHEDGNFNPGTHREAGYRSV